MTPEQAQAIYLVGQDAVVAYLCALEAQVQASHREIEALQRKVAQLSKDSSNSSKRPSSDDITKPKGGKKTRGAEDKGNKIGGQPGHPKHSRAPYPPEAISHVHEHHSMGCPLCGAPDIAWIEDLPPRVIQQTEVKEIVVTREEHRTYAYWCEACGQIHYAELYVLFRIDKYRGSKVLIEVLGKEFEGTLGCDYFSAYVPSS